MHPEQIKAEMRMAGTTPAMLADELGVANSSISQVIYGRAESARIKARIAKIIGKPVTAIWPGAGRTTLRRSQSTARASA